MSDRLTELRTTLKTKLDENDRIAEEFKIEDNGGVVVSERQATNFRQNLKDAAEIKALIEMEEGQLELKGWAGESAGGSVAMRAAAELASAAAANGGRSAPAGSGFGPGGEVKSIGELFTGSEEFKALLASGGANMQAPWAIEGVDLASGLAFEKKGMDESGVETKDVYTTLPGTFTTLGFGQSQRDPIVPLQQRTGRVRDLFPQQTTSANLIDYFRVSGFTNNASPVPERSGGAFGAKPQSGLEFTPAQAPVRTIAHWEAAHRNVLDDEPQLQGIINNELLYGLRLHEDYQILNGTGTSEDLEGLLVVPGTQTYAQSAGPGTDNYADAVRRAMTRITLAYFDATGVVVHPYDWEAMELSKDSQGRYLLTTQVAVGAQKQIWRTPVVDSPAMPQHTALVGAFGLGAQLYDRMVGTIRIAEQHSDFFIRNALVILAEERLALAVKRPESFCKVTLTP